MTKAQSSRRQKPQAKDAMHPVLAALGYGMVIASVLSTLTIIVLRTLSTMGHK